MAQFVGIKEMARIYAVSSATITNWIKQSPQFPQPVAILKTGPVFGSKQVENWRRRNFVPANPETTDETTTDPAATDETIINEIPPGEIIVNHSIANKTLSGEIITDPTDVDQPVGGKKAAKVIAVINLKGGVAKTTTTVGLAQFLSGVFHQKVLVIDLDPQTNATTMLIGEERWLELDDQGHTLAALFADALENTANFDLPSVLQKQVGKVAEVSSVDLLPASLKLIDLQDKLFTIPGGIQKNSGPVNILHRAVHSLLNDYDYILIDCPPNLGLMTLNGLRLAQGYLIPTIPDILSTYGIPQIISRVARFAGEMEISLPPLGIVAAKVRGNSEIHQRTLNKLRQAAHKPIPDSSLSHPALFAAYFPENAHIAAAAEFLPYTTLRQKWGYQGQYDDFCNFTHEFINICEEL
jgi:chromosome partitioning protein